MQVPYLVVMEHLLSKGELTMILRRHDLLVLGLVAISALAGTGGTLVAVTTASDAEETVRSDDSSQEVSLSEPDVRNTCGSYRWPRGSDSNLLPPYIPIPGVRVVNPVGVHPRFGHPVGLGRL